MTKEEKVLWATWMASTDIVAYADNPDIYLDFNQMMKRKRVKIWDGGLRITLLSGLECVAYPYKSYYYGGWNELSIMFLTLYEGTLIEIRGIPPEKAEKLVVEELKRVNFSAPWVDAWEVKSILVAKWGKNWKETD